jgi:hypothetical protein
MHWFPALIYSGIIVALVVFLSGMLGMYWPEGVLLG